MVKYGHVVFEICERTDKNRHTDTLSQYFAPLRSQALVLWVRQPRETACLAGYSAVTARQSGEVYVLEKSAHVVSVGGRTDWFHCIVIAGDFIAAVNTKVA